MTHPIFARLDEQLRLVEAELRNLGNSDAGSRRLKRINPALYDAWTHRSAVAEGIRSVYTGLESIMKAIADEIDLYEAPRSDNWHEKLIDQLAVSVDGVRDAVLRPDTRAMLHELRRFRHVVHHNYAQHLDMAKVLENRKRVEKAFAAFKGDYARLSKALQAPRTKRRGRGPR